MENLIDKLKKNAETSIAKQDYEKANFEINQGLSLNQNSAEFLLLRAQLYELTGLIEEANQTFDLAYKEADPCNKVRYLIERLRFFNKNHDKYQLQFYQLARYIENKYPEFKLEQYHEYINNFVNTFYNRHFPIDQWPVTHPLLLHSKIKHIETNIYKYFWHVSSKNDDEFLAKLDYVSFFKQLDINEILKIVKKTYECNSILVEWIKYLFNLEKEDDALIYFKKIRFQQHDKIELPPKIGLKGSIKKTLSRRHLIELIKNHSNTDDNKKFMEELISFTKDSMQFLEAQWLLHKFYYQDKDYQSSLKCLENFNISNIPDDLRSFIEQLDTVAYVYQLSSKNDFEIKINTAFALVYGNLAINHLLEEKKENYAERALFYLRLLQDEDPNNQDVADLIQKAIHLHLQDSDTNNKNNHDYVIEQYSDLSNILESIKKKYNESHNDLDVTWLYRGHSNATWELKATIDRYPSLSMSSLIQNFILKAPQFINGLKLKHDKKDPATVAEMQHYGIATYYLDWSSILDTALYFALSVGDNLSKTPVTQACLWVAIVPNRTIQLLNEYRATPTNNGHEIIQMIDELVMNSETQKQKISDLLNQLHIYSMKAHSKSLLKQNSEILITYKDNINNSFDTYYKNLDINKGRTSESFEKFFQNLEKIKNYSITFCHDPLVTKEDSDKKEEIKKLIDLYKEDLLTTQNKIISLFNNDIEKFAKIDDLTFIVPQISNDRMRQQGSFFSVLKEYSEDKCHNKEGFKKVGIEFIKVSIKDDFEGRINKKIKQEMHQRGFKPTFIYPDMIGLKQEIMEHSVKYST